ncbi:MAG: G1 family endopeptidase [Chlamydiae bacterium]|nr:G1 family endopeptidase [Chlamydiota bacterium]
MRIFLLVLLTSFGLQTGAQSSSSQRIQCTLDSIDHDSLHSQINPVEMVIQKASQNWSGYAGATNILNPTHGAVTAVTGAWVIPVVQRSSNQTYSASWIGIDGLSNGSVEQIGTAHNWINGSQQNYVWFEMYPKSAYVINGFPVANGDIISAWINYLGNGVFQMTIENVTRKVYFTVPTSYTTNHSAQRSSAEWIMEAPSSVSGILPLANFSKEIFTNCQAIIGGVTAPIVNNHWQCVELLMDTSTRAIKALPSTISGGNAFNVTWEHQ